jgi:hypothetical protein
MCRDFKYFGQHIEILMKKEKIQVFGIDANLEPERHAMDADPDSAK